MFPNKKYALYFSPKTITVAHVDGSGVTAIVKVEKEIPWTGETLAKTLLNLKNAFAGPFSIILDDELTFVFAITIPAGAKDERQLVRIKAAEEVPQELGDYGWAYREMLESPDKKDRILQFALVEKKFYDELSGAVLKSQLRVEAIEPAACSLARLFADIPDAKIIIHKGEKTLAFVTLGGLVFSTATFDAEPSASDIMKFAGFVKEKFLVVPHSIFISGAFKNLTDKTPEFSGYKVEAGTLDVFVAEASRPEGTDAGGLKLMIASAEEVAREEAKLENRIIGVPGMAGIPKEAETSPHYRPIADAQANGTYRHKSAFNLFIFLVSFLIIAMNGIILYQRYEIDKIMKTRTPLLTPPLLPATATPTAASESPAPLDLSLYSIEILDGSGAPGAAQTLRDALESLGFQIIATDTAKNLNSAGTLIRYKNLVPPEFKTAIESQLSIRYTILQGPELDSNEKADIIITVGSNTE